MGYRISHKALMALAVVLIVLLWLGASLCLIFGRGLRKDWGPNPNPNPGMSKERLEEGPERSGGAEERELGEAAALLGGQRRTKY